VGVLSVVEETGGVVVTSPPIQVDNVSLAYRMTRNRAGTLKEFAIQAIKRQVRHEEFWAVKDLSFQVQKGEVFGVIGPNGAGKSTLMKMIARVLPPTEGRIVVRGTVAPMIELGAGFNQELTARENIVLYGTLLGRDPSHMRDRVDAICEWAGLTDFVDAPIRTYSSGMLARLGFAVATDVHPDVLVVDEVLAVGDAAFQEKSKARIASMIEEGSSVLFVSHDLETVAQMADHVMWMDHGRVRSVGSPRTVVDEYQSFR
jgi:ABC-type polysaccharide/polyol phosphate transport system ATPase subunit